MTTGIQTATVPAAHEIPVIAGLPLLGNFWRFQRDRLNLFLDVTRTAGDVGAYRIGRQKFILVNSPELSRTILVDRAADFEKSPNFRRFARPVLGNGLLTADNDTQRRQRKLLAPAFQPHRIETHGDVIAGFAERICRTWRDRDTVDVSQEMVRLTLWTVGRTFFDVDVLDEVDELGAALTAAIQGYNGQISAVVPLPIHWPTPRNLRYRRAVRRLDATVRRVIAERRAANVDRGDFLSMLLLARYDDGSPMSDQQVRDEAMNMFMPGHETTAAGLSWTWHLLAGHPEVYERLRAEVDDVLQGRTPTVADLPLLPYALQVFKEVMRLYPPVYMIGRQAMCDMELAGFFVPKGSVLVLSAYALHRRPDCFPDPERFDPDRFAPDNERRLPPHAYQPFGAGPRICIGNHYSLLAAHLVVATLAQRVEFVATSPRRLAAEPMVTLRPRGGNRMVVRHRLSTRPPCVQSHAAARVGSSH